MIKPVHAWDKLIKEYNIVEVYTNHDYEPYATKRDDEIRENLKSIASLLKPIKTR
jgi:deoxyribodipyrimidine photo-lyase